MLAPKLSALHEAFERSDLSVVALYIETCDGVDDHAAELRRQVAKHGLTYPVLDAEAGPIDDPTRERFPWAPHALVVDGKGRVLRTYGHMPRMRTLREDLSALVATGLFPERPDDGWREFRRGAWIDVLVEGRGRPRVERRILKAVSRDGVTLRWGETEKKLFREDLAGVDREYRRTELDPETCVVAGREVRARVFRATWKRLEVSFTERRWIAEGTLVRRELLELCPDGSRVTHTERLVKWTDALTVGDRELECRVVETSVVWHAGRTDERIWTCHEVPGHVVKRVRRSVRDGTAGTGTETVTAFGLR